MGTGPKRVSATTGLEQQMSHSGHRGRLSFQRLTPAECSWLPCGLEHNFWSHRESISEGRGRSVKAGLPSA